jgi:hypothetical protein
MSQLTKYGPEASIADGSEFDHWFYDQMAAIHDAAKQIIAESRARINGKD